MRLKLSERYRPKTLTDVVGQPAVFHLQQLARDPRPCCLLIEGPGGTGKTSAALALANDLGIGDMDLHVENAVHLGIERLDHLFRTLFRYKSFAPNGYRMFVIEELEAVPSPQVQRAMKTYLEFRDLKLIVVATSNGAAGLSKALLQRFKPILFAGGPGLLRAGQKRLEEIWSIEQPGRDMPHGWLDWGVDDEDGDFSMRVALDQMESAIDMIQAAEHLVGVGRG